MKPGAGAMGALLAGGCGVFTAYTAFQPALKEEAEKKAGTFTEQHHEQQEKRDTALSQAIVSDLRDAKKQVTNYETGGFAWGIRQWLFGTPEQPSSAAQSAPIQPSPPEQQSKTSK